MHTTGDMERHAFVHFKQSLCIRMDHEPQVLCLLPAASIPVHPSGALPSVGRSRTLQPVTDP